MQSWAWSQQIVRGFQRPRLHLILSLLQKSCDSSCRAVLPSECSLNAADSCLWTRGHGANMPFQNITRIQYSPGVSGLPLLNSHDAVCDKEIKLFCKDSKPWRRGTFIHSWSKGFHSLKTQKLWKAGEFLAFLRRRTGRLDFVLFLYSCFEWHIATQHGSRWVFSSAAFFSLDFIFKNTQRELGN